MTATTSRHVTVGVDGSAVSVRALDRAAEEAALRALGLEIVYAVPDRDEAEPVLASAAARVRRRHPEVPVTTLGAEGHSAAALVERARHAALTVVGCRGLGSISGTLLGSVSMRLAAHAPGPLLVVRGGVSSRRNGEVLVGLEDPADADTAAYAFQEAELRGARLRVLRSPARRGGAEQTEHRRGGRTAWLSPDAGVAAASARALVEASRTADLVVAAGRPGPPGPGRRLGTVARALLHRAHCPVLFVPGVTVPFRPPPAGREAAGVTPRRARGRAGRP
ncbi:universal stress protein [Streptomyces caeni]|uniref:Universal stress protein n=1 Tax=Streptomyces caeni TaxID=2307231 RepID=A0ABW4IRX1_9ACTN